MSNPSRRLERPPASPAAHGSCLANVRGLEPRRLRLRGAPLEPLCIHVQNWWSASESHRSGYLLARQIRVPSPHPRVGYANDSSASHSLAASSSNFTVWYRLTDLHALRERILLYELRRCWLVQRLGVEPSRPRRAPGLQAGRGPSPSNATNWCPVQIECLRRSVCRTDALHV